MVITFSLLYLSEITYAISSVNLRTELRKSIPGCKDHVYIAYTNKADFPNRFSFDRRQSTYKFLFQQLVKSLSFNYFKTVSKGINSEF